MKRSAMNMGYVNEQLANVNPAYSARFEGASDASVDDQIQIYFAGARSRWSIQIGADYYAVNEIGFNDGEIEWLKDHGMFPDVKRAVLALCAILEQEKNPGAA
jgi:hypothetical protein